MATVNSANTYIVPTTSNEVTMPSQPAFAAYNSATDSNVTGDGTNYTVICDTEIYDQNSDYNNGTGTFTAPVTGRYYLSQAITIGGVTTTSSRNTYVNTSNRNWRQDSGIFLTTRGECRPYSILADMDAADTAAISVVVVDVGGKIDDVIGAANPVTWFCGILKL